MNLKRTHLRRMPIQLNFSLVGLDRKGGGYFDCLVSGEERGVVGLVGLEPTISPL